MYIHKTSPIYERKLISFSIRKERSTHVEGQAQAHTIYTKIIPNMYCIKNIFQQTMTF